MNMSKILFFFSSRRRHTRSLRDWSSDVCSSDLGIPGGTRHGRRGGIGGGGDASGRGHRDLRLVGNRGARGGAGGHRRGRSEERRVGKECRSRWAPSPSTIKREERR